MSHISARILRTSAIPGSWVTIGRHPIPSGTLHPAHIACSVASIVASLACFMCTPKKTADHDQRQKSVDNFFHSHSILSRKRQPQDFEDLWAGFTGRLSAFGIGGIIGRIQRIVKNWRKRLIAIRGCRRGPSTPAAVGCRFHAKTVWAFSAFSLLAVTWASPTGLLVGVERGCYG